jgi:hypothetical protein
VVAYVVRVRVESFNPGSLRGPGFKSRFASFWKNRFSPTKNPFFDDYDILHAQTHLLTSSRVQRATGWWSPGKLKISTLGQADHR